MNVHIDPDDPVDYPIGVYRSRVDAHRAKLEMIPPARRPQLMKNIITFVGIYLVLATFAVGFGNPFTNPAVIIGTLVFGTIAASLNARASS